MANMCLQLSVVVSHVTLQIIASINAEGQITIERIIMESKSVKDFVDAVETNFAQIQSGITALDAQIQTFMSNANTSNLSTEDQTALAQIVSDSSALATAAQAPVVPAVTPGTTTGAAGTTGTATKTPPVMP